MTSSYKHRNDDTIKILMVEDNLDHQELVTWSLKDYNPNIDITAVENGSDCLEFLEKASFNMILLDYNLPDMNGVEILRLIKKRNIEVPVIFITGQGDEKTAIEALKLGASDFIGKIGNYFETLPVVIQHNLDRYKVKKIKDELEMKLEEQDMQLKVMKEKLRKLSLTDSLTGLYNRRYFYERLSEELKRGKRYEKPIACMIIDLDKFKSVNDKYGHPFGDYVVKIMGQLFRESCRETNILARYGGDEFTAILPNTDSEGAITIADRILKRVEQYDFSDKGVSVRMTLSIGIITFPSDTASVDPEQIVSMADSALYKAKAAGGNCQRMYNESSIEVTNDQSMVDLIKQVESLAKEMREKVLVFVKQYVSSMANGTSYLLTDSSYMRSLAMKLSEEVNLPEKDREILKCSMILRNIGMIGINQNILTKPGRLTEAELAFVRMHPMLAADIMKKVNLFKQELPIILHHHEHYDGSGYPYGMKASKIPTGSRIIAIIDAYDAMINKRVYRKPVSLAEARRELLLHAGSQFDPGYINTFIRILSNPEYATPPAIR